MKRSWAASAARVSPFVALCLTFAVVLAVVPRAVSAQAVTGTIIGTVTDSTGAVVAGASVTLTHTGTGLVRHVVTDTHGEYAAPSLPTGTYSVTAELTGFRTVTLSNIEVGVDQRVRMDLKLEVGTMTETVTIEASSPLVSTQTSELGTTIGEEAIETLPLNGRNFVSLTRGVPGVLRGIPGANIDGAGSLAWRASAAFSANGQRPRDNNYMLDGVDNNETWLQTVVIFPSVDALDEFKLQTSTYSAEFGRSLGGVVNIHDQVGRECHERQRLRVPPERRVRREQLLQQPRGPAEAGLQAEPVRRHDRRSDLQGQDVLLRRLPGLPRERRGRRICPPSPRLRDAARGLLGAQPRHLRSRHQHQPFAGNIIPESRWDPAARNVLQPADPRAEHRKGRAAPTGQTDQQLSDQPDSSSGRTIRATSSSITT